MDRETTGIGDAPYKDNPPPEGRCAGCDNLHEHCTCNCQCGFYGKDECDGAKCVGICAGERRECGAVNPRSNGETGDWYCERCWDAIVLKPDDGYRSNLISKLAASHNARNIAEQAKSVAERFAKFAEDFDGGINDLRAAKTIPQAVLAFRRIRMAEAAGNAASSELSLLGSHYTLDDMQVDELVDEFAKQGVQAKPSVVLGLHLMNTRQCAECSINAAMGGSGLCPICDFKEETKNG